MIGFPQEFAGSSKQYFSKKSERMNHMENKNETLNLPFVGISSFGKYPIETDLEKVAADIAVLGVPYDMGTQWRSGTKMGPRGIREASTLYSFGLKGSYDCWLHRDDYFYWYVLQNVH